MNNIEFVKKLKELEKSKRIIYAWGMQGQLITSGSIEQKRKQYPYWYTPDRVAKLLKVKNKKFGMDCSGMIKSILWGFNFNAKSYLGGASYTSNNVPDINSTQLISNCYNVSKDFKKIEIGCLVHKKGHVGIYIGDGLAIECTSKWDNSVLISGLKNLCMMYNGKSREWEKWGYLPYIDYIKDDNINNIKVGDTVEVINITDINGKLYGKSYNNKDFRVWHPNYDVIQIKNDRVVIGRYGVVTTAINIKNLRRMKK